MYVVDNRAGATYSAAALNRVFVGNIPRVLTSQDVRDLFAVFGDVASVDLQTDQATKLNAGHATLSFVKSEDATRAQLNAGWLNICGQKLTVVLAADQAARAQCSALASAVAATAGTTTASTASTISGVASPLVSPCVLLRNMFGAEEFAAVTHHAHCTHTALFHSCVCLALKHRTQEPGFFDDIQEDVRDEAGKFGKVVHLFVDRDSLVCASISLPFLLTSPHFTHQHNTHNRGWCSSCTTAPKLRHAHSRSSTDGSSRVTSLPPSTTLSTSTCRSTQTHSSSSSSSTEHLQTLRCTKLLTERLAFSFYPDSTMFASRGRGKKEWDTVTAPGRSCPPPA